MTWSIADFPENTAKWLVLTLILMTYHECTTAQNQDTGNDSHAMSSGVEVITSTPGNESQDTKQLNTSTLSFSGLGTSQAVVYRHSSKVDTSKTVLRSDGIRAVVNDTLFSTRSDAGAYRGGNGSMSLTELIHGKDEFKYSSAEPVWTNDGSDVLKVLSTFSFDLQYNENARVESSTSSGLLKHSTGLDVNKNTDVPPVLHLSTIGETQKRHTKAIPSQTGSSNADSLEKKTTQEADSTFSKFRLNTNNCSHWRNRSAIEDHKRRKNVFSALQGEVTGVYSTQMFNFTSIYCDFEISVPKQFYLFLEIDMLDFIWKYNTYCDPQFYIFVGSSNSDRHPVIVSCELVTSVVAIPDTNTAYVSFENNNVDPYNIGKFRIRFRAEEHDPRKKMNEVMLSPDSGYVTLKGYDGQRNHAHFIYASHDINLPSDQTLMISFEKFSIVGSPFCFTHHVSLFRIDNTGRVLSQEWKKCGELYIVPKVYNTSVRITMSTFTKDTRVGFKMRYSFHSEHQSPRELGSGVFNCSVPHYASFKQHVHCNMRQECGGGEDEGGHCPFSSPACDGAVAVSDKCYVLIKANNTFPAHEAELECTARGYKLAMIKSPREHRAFSWFFNQNENIDGKIRIGIAGYKAGLPKYYWRISRWLDNTVNYATRITYSWMKKTMCGQSAAMDCGVYRPHYRDKINLQSCEKLQFEAVACEFSSAPTNKSERRDKVRFSSLQTELWKPKSAFVSCRSHVALESLKCFPESQCGVTDSLSQCVLSSPSPPRGVAEYDHYAKQVPDVVQTFQCQQTTKVIPYTFVCDFHHDCQNGSDETFCVHRPCEGFQCGDGNCISSRHVCDLVVHCTDITDEHIDCLNLRNLGHEDIPIPPPAVVTFDNESSFTQTPMNRSDPCPETHFRCPGELDYCLPVYVVCNGVYDCLGHEDEADCGRYTTCPGLYRCWDSPVCLHPEHVCDGVFQCPRHDDELFCNMTCPSQCRCQGLAFVCHQPFSARDFPDLRYLDATGSGMRPEDVSDHVYLVWLSMASCELSHLPVIRFPNLKYLDLSENLLVTVSLDSFVPLVRLRDLRLAGNPLISLLPSNTSTPLRALYSLDASRTQLTSFDDIDSRYFASVEKLNFSHSRVFSIPKKGFRFISNLTHIDIRGNPTTEYSSDAFKALTNLRLFYNSNFRFCCRTFLPDNFEDITCFSPQNEISSCEDLLRSYTYHILLWLLSVMSLLGNAGSFLFRQVAHNNVSKTGLSVFVTNLHLANVLMGVYLAMVGVADALYRGQYLSYERTWTSSAVCKLAGFLSLLSSEVSAFIICLITLDRFIVLRFPYRIKRFQKKPAVAISILLWTAGFILAVIPVLPGASHWEFYGQSGLCIPLPFTKKTFPGGNYFFGIVIILDFILFLFVAAGQSVIYHSVHWSSASNTDGFTTPQDVASARRVMLVVLTDFACRFSVSVLGLLASGGLGISGEVSAALVIVVKPLNSALNPLLYAYSTLRERRQKALEVKLLKLVEARVVARGQKDRETAATASNVHAKRCVAASSDRAVVSTSGAGKANAAASFKSDGPFDVTGKGRDLNLTFEEVFEFLGKCLVSKTTTLEEIDAALIQSRPVSTPCQEDERF